MNRVHKRIVALSNQRNNVNGFLGNIDEAQREFLANIRTIEGIERFTLDINALWADLSKIKETLNRQFDAKLNNKNDARDLGFDIRALAGCLADVVSYKNQTPSTESAEFENQYETFRNAIIENLLKIQNEINPIRPYAPPTVDDNGILNELSTVYSSLPNNAFETVSISYAHEESNHEPVEWVKKLAGLLEAAFNSKNRVRIRVQFDYNSSQISDPLTGWIKMKFNAAESTKQLHVVLVVNEAYILKLNKNSVCKTELNEFVNNSGVKFHYVIKHSVAHLDIVSPFFSPEAFYVFRNARGDTIFVDLENRSFSNGVIRLGRRIFNADQLNYLIQPNTLDVQSNTVVLNEIPTSPVAPHLATFERITGEALSIANCFVNLAIVKESEQQTKESQKPETKRNNEPNDAFASGILRTLEDVHKPKNEPNDAFASGILGTWEDIHNPKQPIELADIFNLSEGLNPVKKIMILGRAGIGKSTLCQKIEYAHAAERLWAGKFEDIVKIKMREVTPNRIETTSGSHAQIAAQIVNELCYEGEPIVNGQTIKDYFQNKLLIVDGLDESTVSPEESLGLGIRHLMKHVPNQLLTSRPHHSFTGLTHDLVLETIGFTDTDIDQYIRTVVPAEQTIHGRNANGLIDYLRQNPNIRGICHVPVQLDILCSLWTDPEPSDLGFPLSMTDLYKIMETYLINRMWKRANKKPGKLSKDDRAFRDQSLAILKKLAFDGMKNRKIIVNLPTTECEDNNIALDDWISLGFVKPTGVATKDLNNRLGYFIHLTFQEYFAAKHMVTLSPADRTAEIEEMKYDPFYNVTLSFLVGMLSKESRDEAKVVLECIAGYPKAVTGVTTVNCSDLVVHGRLLIRCFNECDLSLLDEMQGERFWVWQQVREKVREIFHRNGLKFNSAKYTLLRDGAIYPRFYGYNQDYQTLLLDKLENDKSSDDVIVSIDNVRALDFFGHGSHVVVDALMGVFFDDSFKRDTSGDIKTYTVFALKKYVQGNQGVLDRFLRFLGDASGDEYHQQSAVKALEYLGDGSAQVIEGLVNVLQNSSYHPDVRMAATDALGNIGRGNPAVMGVLVELLKDNLVGANVRRAVAVALGKIGRGNDDVINELVNVLKDSSDDAAVRGFAAEALGNISSRIDIGSRTDKVITELVNVLKDGLDDKDVRDSAAKALGTLRDDRPDVIDALVQILGDSSSSYYIRNLAAEALGKLGNNEKGVIEALVGIFNQPSDAGPLYTAVAIAWVTLSPKDPNIIPTLVRVIRENSWPFLIKALGNRCRGNQSVIEAFIQVLTDSNVADGVRMSVVEALEKIGEGNQGVIDTLASVSDDLSIPEGVRHHAGKALRKLGPTRDQIEGLFQELKSPHLDKRTSVALDLVKNNYVDNNIINALIQGIYDRSSTQERCNSAFEALLSLRSTRNQDLLKHCLSELTQAAIATNQSHLEAPQKLLEDALFLM